MASQAMAVANDQTLSELINSAQRRLVYLAPGVSHQVAGALIDSYQRLPHECIAIILDVDPEVCRVGYGDIKALEELEKASSKVGGMIQHQPGIRIGLVIADGRTLVWAPTPQLIEAAPKTDQDKPNAIRVGDIPPADLERDLGLGSERVAEQTIGMDKVTRADIAQAKKSLEANPPQRFDISRTVRVFNAQFEFVELSLTGAALDRRRIQIPERLLGIAALSKDGPVMSLRVAVQLDDVKQFNPMIRLGRVKNAILKRFCKQLPGYGHVVLRKDKPDLIKYVTLLSRLAQRRQLQLNQQLVDALNAKHDALMEMLLPLVQRTPPPEWKNVRNAAVLEELVHREIAKSMASAFDSFKPVEVRLIFKAVTYESLSDAKFTDLVREHFPKLKELHEEFDAAAGQRLKSTQPEKAVPA